jgi:hypothetical protein
MDGGHQGAALLAHGRIARPAAGSGKEDAAAPWTPDRKRCGLGIVVEAADFGCLT